MQDPATTSLVTEYFLKITLGTLDFNFSTTDAGMNQMTMKEPYMILATIMAHSRRL
jgi:hypothetical protein